MKISAKNNLIFLSVIVFINSVTIYGLKLNTKIFAEKNPNLIDSKHGIRMGQISPECDDAKVSYF